MRNDQALQPFSKRFALAFCDFVLRVLRFFLSFEFVVGLIVGLSLAISAYTSSLNEWAENGGFAQACSQLESKKQ